MRNQARPSLRLPASLLCGLALLSLASFAPPPAGAQADAQREARLQGVVFDEVTRELISSAVVSIIGEDLETRSGPTGTFAFPTAPLGVVSIRVEAPGYPVMVEEVEVSADRIIFLQVPLPKLDAVLDALLARGRARGEDARRGEARTAAELLAERVPGVRPTTGEVGRNYSPLLLRGINTFTLSGDPAIYLDGVRIEGGIGRVMDVLTQIPASAVKDIRILRGPAAAFLQGAANGAILVETVSGPDG